MKPALFVSGAVLALLAWSAVPAQAKAARCFTTDDGYYSCNFRGLDDAGRFRISAPGYPTFTLEVDRPGFAYGYANYGSGNVSLPGQYVRSRDDGACWNNPKPRRKSAPGNGIASVPALRACRTGRARHLPSPLQSD